jgi:hypothetical protein
MDRWYKVADVLKVTRLGKICWSTKKELRVATFAGPVQNASHSSIFHLNCLPVGIGHISEMICY